MRGKYVLMGGADCTYDFRELQAFFDKLREGNEFVMGSRFRGYIEAGSMPRAASLFWHSANHVDSEYPVWDAVLRYSLGVCVGLRQRL